MGLENPHLFKVVNDHRTTDAFTGSSGQRFPVVGLSCKVQEKEQKLSKTVPKKIGLRK